jgi:hypothetical protein
MSDATKAVKRADWKADPLAATKAGNSVEMTVGSKVGHWVAPTAAN